MTIGSLGATLCAMKRIVWALLLVALLPLVAQESATQELQNTSSADQQRSALLAKIASKVSISKQVAEAFDAVPRERFLPSYLANMAYEDTSLPLGNGQTLPSPSELLAAVQALDVRPNDSVLVVGASTGYLAALLSRLASHVYDIELVTGDRSVSRRIFASLGFANISVSNGSAADAFATAAPFNRVFIHGAAADVPQSIFSQLAPNGKMIVPLRDPTGFQMVVELSRSDGGLAIRTLGKGFFSPIQIGVAK